MAELRVWRLLPKPKALAWKKEPLNPLVVDAMAEVEVDISRQATQKVFDVWKLGKLFGYVITVCDAASAEKCPIFRVCESHALGFPRPSALIGSRKETLIKVREIRDEIRQKIEEWCEEVCAARC